MAAPTTKIRAGAGNAKILPVWDGRSLWLGRKLVKRFGQPATSQTLILAAFQEQGWASRIDDPLPGGDNVDPRERLKEAVRGLNRFQKNRLIRFFRDGTGKGVMWELIDAKD